MTDFFYIDVPCNDDDYAYLLLDPEKDTEVAIDGDPEAQRFVVAYLTGQVRPPREGEWYTQGGTKAYRSRKDFTGYKTMDKCNIAKLTVVRRVEHLLIEEGLESSRALRDYCQALRGFAKADANDAFDTLVEVFKYDKNQSEKEAFRSACRMFKLANIPFPTRKWMVECPTQ